NDVLAMSPRCAGRGARTLTVGGLHRTLDQGAVRPLANSAPMHAAAPKQIARWQLAGCMFGRRWRHSYRLTVPETSNGQFGFNERIDNRQFNDDSTINPVDDLPIRCSHARRADVHVLDCALAPAVPAKPRARTMNGHSMRSVGPGGIMSAI